MEICYPKVSGAEARVLSQKEQEIFVKYLTTDMDFCKFGILFALLTGARIGEICALQWENISLHDKNVRIVSSMQRLRDTHEIRKKPEW